MNHPDAKLEAALPALYEAMHAAGAFRGDSWRLCLDCFQGFVPDWPRRRTLDYGCGPTGGLAQDLGAERVVSYDPFVPAYAKDPWKAGASVFFSCDVLEHMTAHQVNQLLARVGRHEGLELVFCSVSTRPANKTLPNGLNAHLLVRPPHWWYGVFEANLGPRLDCALARADLLRDECIFGYVRRAAVLQAAAPAAPPPEAPADAPG